MDAALLDDVITRAQQRDPQAFDELVDAYSGRLFGYFCRLTGSRDDAEDLLQEVFVRLVRTIDRYEHDGRFEAWLFRIATNLVRDRIRKAQRRGELNSSSNSYEADATNQLANLSDDKAVSPDDQLRLREEVDELQQALDDLPDAEREVICLRHFSGLSFKEVAEAMGTPIGTALARAHRGLARLKEMMTP